MDINQQKQSLHCNYIYPLAVWLSHSQNFQVSEAQDEEAERKAATVEQRCEGGVDSQLRHLVQVQVNCAWGVSVAVASPVHHQLSERKDERVKPGVGHDQKSVPVAHLAGVSQRKYYRYPPVHAQRRHAQHGITGDKSLGKADDVAEQVPQGVCATDHPQKSGRHVDNTEEDVR